MALAEYGNAFNIDTDENGDPILIDAQSGQTVATYDRTQSAWVYGDIISDSVNTESADVTNQMSAGSVSTESADVTNQMSAGSVSTETLSTDWTADAGDYDTLQDAVDTVGSSKPIKVPPGGYNPVTLTGGETLIGCRPAHRGGNPSISSTDEPAITISGGDVTVKNIVINTFTDEETSADGIVIDGQHTDIWIMGCGITNISGVFIVSNGLGVSIINNKARNNFIDGDTVVLTSDSRNNLVDGNGSHSSQSFGTISDSGFGNVVGSNT